MGAGADDTFHSVRQDTQAHGWNNTATVHRGGNLLSGGNNFVYACDARLTSVTIGQGDTIDVGYITLNAAASLSNTVVNTNVQAVDEDNAAIATSDVEHDADPLTTALTAWDNIAAWTINTEYSSPSIISVIQEIVDRASWASGNAIVIRWADDASDSNAYRQGYTYNNDTTKAPKLHIEYTAGGAVTVTPGVLAMTTTAYAPPIGFGFIPSVKALTTTKYAPAIGLGVIPSTASLTTTTYAPPIGTGVIPPTASLTTTTYAPPIGTGVVPSTASLTTTGLAPAVGLGVVPATVNLIMSFLTPVIDLVVTIAGVIPPFGRSKMTRRIGLGRLKR